MFGRDIVQIPCFRDSLLNGIYTGVATIVITLMATSRPRLAGDAGISVFCTVTLGSFIYCRYQRDKTKKLLTEAKTKNMEFLATENKMDEP